MTEFEKYLKQAREKFSHEVSKYTVEDNLDLRTASDSLLIAFDQATEKAINYTRCSKELCEHKSLQSAMCEVDYCPDCDTYIPS
jgi:hypothetical protein